MGISLTTSRELVTGGGGRDFHGGRGHPSMDLGFPCGHSEGSTMVGEVLGGGEATMAHERSVQSSYRGRVRTRG